MLGWSSHLYLPLLGGQPQLAELQGFPICFLLSLQLCQHHGASVSTLCSKSSQPSISSTKAAGFQGSPCPGSGGEYGVDPGRKLLSLSQSDLKPSQPFIKKSFPTCCLLVIFRILKWLFLKILFSYVTVFVNLFTYHSQKSH